MLNWLLRRTASKPKPLTRRYEIRYLDNGAVMHAAEAENGCAFELAAFANGQQVLAVDAPPPTPTTVRRSLATYVAATGERLSLQTEIPNGRCRLAGENPGQWCDAKGRYL